MKPKNTVKILLKNFNHLETSIWAGKKIQSIALMPYLVPSILFIWVKQCVFRIMWATVYFLWSVKTKSVDCLKHGNILDCEKWLWTKLLLTLCLQPFGYFWKIEIHLIFTELFLNSQILLSYSFPFVFSTSGNDYSIVLPIAASCSIFFSRVLSPPGWLEPALPSHSHSHLFCFKNNFFYSKNKNLPSLFVNFFLKIEEKCAC